MTQALRNIITEELTSAVKNVAQGEVIEDDGMEDSIVSSMTLDEDSTLIEFEIRTNPTLAEICEKTDNFTVLEKELPPSGHA